MTRPLISFMVLAFLFSGSSLNRSAERIQFRGQEFDTYVVDLSRSDLSLYWKDGRGQNYNGIGNLKQALRQQGRELQFATNAGMFGQDGRPVDLHIENGVILVQVDTASGDGNFYLKPNGIFAWKGGKPYLFESSEYRSRAEPFDFATQSGPMLLLNGNLHPAFREGSKNVFIRSGVGLMSGSKVVFAISRGKCNFYDFALLFRDQFKCRNALYLDGAISKMYLPGLDRFETGGNFGGIISVTNKMG